MEKEIIKDAIKKSNSDLKKTFICEYEKSYNNFIKHKNEIKKYREDNYSEIGKQLIDSIHMEIDFLKDRLISNKYPVFVGVYLDDARRDFYILFREDYTEHMLEHDINPAKKEYYIKNVLDEHEYGHVFQMIEKIFEIRDDINNKIDKIADDIEVRDNALTSILSLIDSRFYFHSCIDEKHFHLQYYKKSDDNSIAEMQVHVIDLDKFK